MSFLHLPQSQRFLNVYFPTIVLVFKVTTSRCCFNSRFKANNTMFASNTKLTFYERFFQTIILSFKVTANIRCFNRYVKTTRKCLQVTQNQRFMNVNFKTNNTNVCKCHQNKVL